MNAPRDDFERMAAVIAASPDDYREEVRLPCGCTADRRTLAVVYVGPGGHKWLWVTGGRTRGQDGGELVPFPARAIPIPAAPGDPSYPTPATCPRCRAGWLLVPVIGGVRVAGKLPAPTYARVVSARRDSAR